MTEWIVTIKKPEKTVNYVLEAINSFAAVATVQSMITANDHIIEVNENK